MTCHFSKHWNSFQAVFVTKEDEEVIELIGVQSDGRRIGIGITGLFFTRDNQSVDFSLPSSVENFVQIHSEEIYFS